MPRSIKINQVAPIGFGILILITIVTNLLSQWSTNNLLNSLTWVTHTYKVKEDLVNLEKLVVDAQTGQRGFIITGKENFLDPYNKAIQEINKHFANLKDKMKDNSQQTYKLAILEKLVQEKLEEFASLNSLKRMGKEAQIKAIYSTEENKQSLVQIRAEISAMHQVEDELLMERQKSAAQAQVLSNYLDWGGVLLAIVIGLFISIAIARIISRSLGVAVAVAERVSAGDLTAQLEVTSNDEIGKLINAFRTMNQSLNSLISQVQKSGIQVNTSAIQIAASGKQLEATVTEQVASTNEVVATAKEIAATSGQLVHTMEELAVMSQTTTNAANSGQKDIVRMETTMRQLAEATSSIAAKLGVISEKANNINGVVNTITKVADRTNLLSLNAAIEAEKAGEYGLGFAVVAREIRRLADQTAVSTLDIEQMVKEMQSAVSTGVMEMDKFTKEVGRSVEDVRSISGQLAEIIEQVQALTPRFEVVNQGMETQSLGAMQISEAMTQLSEASSQTVESLREINGAIGQLNEASQGLRQEISRFRVNS